MLIPAKLEVVKIIIEFFPRIAKNSKKYVLNFRLTFIFAFVTDINYCFHSPVKGIVEVDYVSSNHRGFEVYQLVRRMGKRPPNIIRVESL
jgi:hypothetical protein